MFNLNKGQRLTGVAIALAMLSGCGGSDSAEGEILLTCDVPLIPDVMGASCVAPPPISCPVPTVPDALNESCIIGLDPNAAQPTVFAESNQAILFYNRPQDATNSSDDSVYEGYRLHTWNDATCDAYAPSFDSTPWDNGHEHDGIDPVYGAYWILELKEGFGECGNFIIHIGTDDAGKELGGDNKKMPLMQDDPTYSRMNFTISKNADVFEYPIASLGPQLITVEDIAAHWIDNNIIVWDISDEAPAMIKLHHSNTGDLAVDPDSQTLNGTAIELTDHTLTQVQQDNAPLVKDWAAFSGAWSADEAKAILKNQLALAAYNSDGELLKATFIQADKVLDSLYTVGDDDADEKMLGVNYNNDNINFDLWAPTAQAINIKFFNADKTDVSSHAMTEDSNTGVWSYAGDAALDRLFYRYQVTVYHPQNGDVETIEVTDPYSVSLSTNGDYSQVVNLSDDSLKPQGWDSQENPTIENPEDAVIYEGHIRDFSILDNSTTQGNRGKYMAFTEVDSMPNKHLKKLADNGLTHFQFLPNNDIASINEDSSKIVNLTDTVGDLCKLKSDAQICKSEDSSAVLRDVLAGFSPYTNEARDLMNVVREFDSFNWGYDPKHFNAPEGSYASDADGVARIIEMRAMNMALHNMGLRVVMDVVYNHTNSSGLWEHSVLDKVVPGYYHSRDLITGAVVQSTCCNDTALEHRMMDKLMQDSLVNWATHYGVDAFRFDIMSHGSKAQMLAARDAVQVVDPDNYFYGEGWSRSYRGFEHADQGAMAGTQIATFNDRLRDGIRNGAMFTEDGDLHAQDIVRFGMAGTLSEYVLKDQNGVATSGKSFSPNMYAKDPADNINYISKHDNETLWDKLQLGNPTDKPLDERTGLSFERSTADRVRAQNLAHSIVLLSQGIPFVQMGGDFLRSKSLDRNTYDAGDWYNKVDFELQSNNWNVGLPIDKGNQSDETLIALAASPYTTVTGDDMSFASTVFNEFLAIRTSSQLFRLTSSQDIIERVGFHNIGKNQQQGLIVMSIDDGTSLTDLDPNVDAVVVVVNASEQEKVHTIESAAGFELSSIQQNSMDSDVKSASFSDGTFVVPPLTTAVFVKSQGDAQGSGLSAYATSGAPDVVPFGATAVLVRGAMNGWGESDQAIYVADGIYRVSIDLALNADGYEFKIASADWSTVDFGALAGESVVTENEAKTLTRSGDNMKFTPAVAGRYVFEIDASNVDAPVINVRNEDVYADTTIYVRGDVNGWGTTDPLVHLGASLYSATIGLTDAGDKAFKVADENWGPINLGAVTPQVILGEWSTLLAGSNDNFSTTFETGDYTFLLDASNIDAQQIGVFKSQMFADTAVFLRGSMNGWGTDNPIVYQGNGVYSLTIALTAGDYQFKVASEDWSTFNFGADSNALVSVEQRYHAQQGSNGNLTISIATDGDYTFEVTGPSITAPSLTVKQVQ